MRSNQSLFKSVQYLIILFFTSAFAAQAQTPADAIMMKPGEFCGGIFYNNGTSTEYWEGDSLRTHTNAGTITRHTISAGFVVGIVKNLDFYFNLPYMIITPSAGEVAGETGIQDVSFAVKYQLLDKEVGPGKFKALVSASFATPASDYVPEAAFALGAGCPYGVGRGVLAYRANMGLYGKLQAGYHLRGNSNLVRTYYYTDTEAYNSNEIDMTDAVDYSLTVGYVTENLSFKVEAEYGMFNTIGGFDIRNWDGGFPTNDVEK